jgi:PmbA protein
MTTTKKDEMLTVAEACVAIAKKKGAKDASARAYRVRNVGVNWRDGRVDKVEEATTRGVMLQLYVDGRYSTASTSDLRPAALERFIEDNIAVAKTLAEDPFRALPDPELYKNQAKQDLQLEDPKYSTVTAALRRSIAKEIEDAARGVKGADAILSASSNFGDTLNETFLVTSNGFSGMRRDTSFFMSAGVSVRDANDRRPEDYAVAGARFFKEIGVPKDVGREAAERALKRRGAKKGESATMKVAIDRRAAGRILGFMSPALNGASLQQKRSFLEGKVGTEFASKLMTLIDDPLIPKALGSRLFDAEGLAAKQRPIFEAGVLRNYYIDTYYGRKLNMQPTSGSFSNITWKLGDKSQVELLKEIGEGILITNFIGGNSNPLTGDFSTGVQGFRIHNGELAEPIAEMNLSENHLEFWKKLVAVGNDPYPYSAVRTPTLVFDGVSIAGT